MTSVIPSEVEGSRGASGKRSRVVFAVAVALETALLAVLTRFGDFSRHNHAAIFVALFLAASGAYFVAASLLSKAFVSSALTFWIVAIILRVAVFVMPPADDVWRYIWEGRIQLHGFNPYLLSPQAEELLSLRDVLWTRINHPDFASIYPPLAQLVFAALAAVSESPWFFKLIFTLADLAAVAIFLRLTKSNLRLAAWYAWNPLVVCSFAGAGHYDSLMIAPLLAAVLALNKARVPSSCAWLGIAIATKVVPLFLLPVWFFAAGRRRVWLLVSVGIPWALTLWFGGWAVVQKPLTNFTNVTRFNDMVWWFAEAAVWPNPEQRNERYTVVLAYVAAALAFVFRNDWKRGVLWVLGAALLLSPVLHPWYLTWILPFACWRRAWPWIAFSCSVLIALLVWEKGPFWGKWQITWPLRLAEMLVPAIVLIAALIRRRLPPPVILNGVKNL